MSFNKFRFKSFKEFKSIQDTAISQGFDIIEAFSKFLEKNYSHLKM